MRKSSIHINRWRVRDGVMASGDDFGMTGAFMIPMISGKMACVVSSDGTGPSVLGYGRWEHVSVSLPNRCPEWGEMCLIKGFFWDEEETVMQLHPPKSKYVNNHPYCLHLWRPLNWNIPMPPDILVGIK